MANSGTIDVTNVPVLDNSKEATEASALSTTTAASMTQVTAAALIGTLETLATDIDQSAQASDMAISSTVEATVTELSTSSQATKTSAFSTMSSSTFPSITQMTAGTFNNTLKAVVSDINKIGQAVIAKVAHFLGKVVYEYNIVTKPLLKTVLEAMQAAGVQVTRSVQEMYQERLGEWDLETKMAIILPLVCGMIILGCVLWAIVRMCCKKGGKPKPKATVIQRGRRTTRSQPVYA